MHAARLGLPNFFDVSLSDTYRRAHTKLPNFYVAYICCISDWSGYDELYFLLLYILHFEAILEGRLNFTRPYFLVHSSHGLSESSFASYMK